MLIESVEQALNKQLTEELYSANLYLSMAGWCENLGLGGAARWLKAQSAEELEHAHKIYDYLTERDARVRVGAVKAPPSEWSAPQAVFEDAYHHEQEVSHWFGQLVELAERERDHLTFQFLQWFVEEQVEEEATAKTIVDRFKLAGANSSALLLIDQELGSRE